MVKAEVDREIRAEKRRRKSRKKQKRMMDVLDDKVLESVWRKTIEEGIVGSNSIRKTREAAANAIGRKPHRSSSHLKSKESENRTVKQSIGHGLESILAATGQFLSVIQLTGGLMQSRAPPKSRLTALSRREIEDDLILEEAWIDSKILHAKERHRAE